MSYWMRVKALFQTKQLDRDLEDELAFHLAMREEKNRERGIEGEEARYAARRHFGNVTRIKEACREAWMFVSLESTWRELGYGARAPGVGANLRGGGLQRPRCKPRRSSERRSVANAIRRGSVGCGEKYFFESREICGDWRCRAGLSRARSLAQRVLGAGNDAKGTGTRR